MLPNKFYIQKENNINLHPEHRTIYYFLVQNLIDYKFEMMFPRNVFTVRQSTGHLGPHQITPVFCVQSVSSLKNPPPNICNVSTSEHLTEYKLVNIAELLGFYYEIRSLFGRKVQHVKHIPEFHWYTKQTLIKIHKHCKNDIATFDVNTLILRMLSKCSTRKNSDVVRER